MERPEFSRPASVAELEPGVEHRRELEAAPEERAALARRFDLLALDSLRASLTILRGGVGHGVEVQGRLAADVVQRCVVTLEPVAAHVEDSFAVRYLPGVSDQGDEAFGLDPEAMLDGPDIEPLEGDVIDLGEVVAQSLSLALDPYPRAPGVALPAADGGTEAPEGPFAMLSRLRRDG